MHIVSADSKREYAAFAQNTTNVSDVNLRKSRPYNQKKRCGPNLSQAARVISNKETLMPRIPDQSDSLGVLHSPGAQK